MVTDANATKMEDIKKAAAQMKTALEKQEITKQKQRKALSDSKPQQVTDAAVQEIFALVKKNAAARSFADAAPMRLANGMPVEERVKEYQKRIQALLT
jgi:hypothetical protein